MKRIVVIILLVVLGLFLSEAIRLDYGHPRGGVSQHYVKHGMTETGARNLVASIYLNYRVYDTLGEAVVFFASALGVFMLLRKEMGEEKEWNRPQG